MQAFSLDENTKAGGIAQRGNQVLKMPAKRAPGGKSSDCRQTIRDIRHAYVSIRLTDRRHICAFCLQSRQPKEFRIDNGTASIQNAMLVSIGRPYIAPTIVLPRRFECAPFFSNSDPIVGHGGGNARGFGLANAAIRQPSGGRRLER